MSVSVDDELDTDPELRMKLPRVATPRMKLPRVATPQATLPEVGEQGDPVSHVKLHIECQRTAVDEGVPVMKRGAVIQHLFAPVHRFISGKSRSPCLDEHDCPVNRASDAMIIAMYFLMVSVLEVR